MSNKPKTNAMNKTKQKDAAPQNGELRLINYAAKRPLEFTKVKVIMGPKIAVQMAREARAAHVGLDGDGEYATLGNRLGNIRDFKLFQFLAPPGQKPYANFSSYCLSEESLSGSAASKLINSARMATVIHDAGLVVPKTRDQMHRLLSLADDDAVKVLKEAIEEVGHDQPSSVKLNEAAVKLKLRTLGTKKAKKAKVIHELIAELERAVEKPEHAELSALVFKLKAAVLSKKVAVSATSEDPCDPAAPMAVNPPKTLQAPEDQAVAPAAAKWGADAALDLSSLPIPAVDSGTPIRSASSRSAALVTPCQPSIAMASGNGYTIKVVGGLVEIHFESKEDSSRLRAIVPKWPLLFRYDGDTENWYSRDDSKETACGLMERTETIFKESSQW